MRKINWGLRIIYNFFRLSVLSVLYYKKFKSDYLSLLSPFSHLKISSKGKIFMGKKCMIDDGSLVRASGGEIIIGNNVYINRNCNIISKSLIQIKDGVSIGPNVSIYDHDHAIDKNDDLDYVSDHIIIGENVWIGSNVIILKGVNIGSNSVIAAGTIVTKNVGKNKLIYNELRYKIKDI